MTRHLPLLALALVAAAPASTPAITSALADPARADQQGDDARRQAAAVLAFSGVKPGDTVIDYLPGQGYWTRIFTGIVGPRGHVYAYWRQGAEKYAERALPGLQARGYANVTAEVQATKLPTAPVERPANLFWTAQNYHDIPAAAIGAFNAAVFKSLKPDSVYLVIDHADGRGALPTTPSKHRIDPAVVRSQVAAAGFRFVGQSTVLPTRRTIIAKGYSILPSAAAPTSSYSSSRSRVDRPTRRHGPYLSSSPFSRG